MSEQEKKLDGPDFAQGVALAGIAEGGMMLGHTAGDAVLLARRGQELFAIGAECTHYHGPLAEGVLVEDTVRCPWHQRMFQSENRGSVTHTGVEPSSVLARRTPKRDGLCSGKARADSGQSAVDTAGCAGDHRHCRRRRRRGSRRGDATA